MSWGTGLPVLGSRAANAGVPACIFLGLRLCLQAPFSPWLGSLTAFATWFPTFLSSPVLVLRYLVSADPVLLG